MKTTLDRSKKLFFVVSNHLGKHKIVFENLEKNDEVVLIPSGQPVFWVSQLLYKIRKATEKVPFNIFLPNFFA